MSDDLGEIVDNYCRTWDVGAPQGLIEEVYAPDVVDHNPQPGQMAGIDGVKMITGLYHAVFPDLHVSNDDVIISGDRGVLRWSATGTHEGDQLGIPATHRTVHLTGIDILRIADGRVVERWGETNGLELMQQLGVAG
jgi:predicted ester cyclase